MLFRQLTMPTGNRGQAEADNVESPPYPSGEEIKTWSAHALVEWLQTDLKPLLSSKDEGTIRTARIAGRAFLLGAGKSDLFTRAGLPFGPSEVLADVAEEIVGKKSKYCNLYYECYSDS
jgi:hypothetical protein